MAGVGVQKEKRGREKEEEKKEEASSRLFLCDM